MLDAITGVLTPYVTVLLLSTGISVIALLVLGLTSPRSYKWRTWTMFIPLAGSVALALRISPSCFAHYLSLTTGDPVHLICADPSFAYVTYVCSSWVTLITASFSTAAILGIISYYLGGWTVRTLYGYQEVDGEEIGDLYYGIEEMSDRAGIYTPGIYLIESSKPQIFSHGGHGEPSIFISVGLLETLTEEEILACVGHEVAHIKNSDTLVRSVASSLKIASLFNLVGFLTEPMLARDREFLADEEGARLSGNPRALISALLKLSQVSPSGFDNLLLGSLSLSQFIPRNGKLNLLSRHPPIEERVKRLMKLL
ncbi:MAG: M48 family metallopeptidase [Candidatus Bathyarchaeota archaeon]|nr:M48 family metallopeptidase [Candidatus Bathyarchaeota archaeon]